MAFTTVYERLPKEITRATVLDGMSKKIITPFIPFENQLTNIYTKSLAENKLSMFSNVLDMIDVRTSKIESGQVINKLTGINTYIYYNI